jgi:hypothetical protein
MKKKLGHLILVDSKDIAKRAAGPVVTKKVSILALTRTPIPESP